MPDQVAIPFAILVFSLLVFIPLGLILGMRKNHIFPHERVGKTRIMFNPKSLKDHGFDPVAMVAFFEFYKKAMPEAFAIIGVKTSSEEIQKHLDKLGITFTLGYLKSHVRAALGMNDLNNDGKENLITGLTHSPSTVEVAIVPATMLDDNQKVLLKKTAFCYEVHNSVVWALAGYSVAMGEAFVSDDDQKVIPWLEGKSLKDMKKKRQVLDAAYKQVKLNVLFPD